MTGTHHSVHCHVCSVLHDVRTKQTTPDSDFFTNTQDAPVLPSKCAASHRNKTEEAVSAMPTRRCMPQKKLLSELVLACSSGVVLPGFDYSWKNIISVVF